MNTPSQDDSPRTVATEALSVRNGHDYRHCPGALEWAAFLDRTLSDEQRSLLEHHAATCDRCAQLLAMVSEASIETSTHLTVVPETLLASIGRLVEQREHGRRVATALSGWSVAAAAAIFFSLAGYQIGLVSGMKEQDVDVQLLTAISLGALETSEQDGTPLESLVLPEEGVRP